LSDLFQTEPDKIRLTPVHGGITNHLVKAEITLSSDEQRHCLVRLLGKGGSMLIDRSKETEIVQELSSLGFGPQIVSLFSNGRVEHFFHNRRNLETEEMMEAVISKQVALTLRDLHGMTVQCVDKQNIMIWNNFLAWTELLGKLSGHKELEFEVQVLGEIKTASLTVTNLIESNTSNPLTEVVFCHNDLLAGNILIRNTPASGGGSPPRKNQRALEFIDFEYAGYNYAGFDIANHFAAVCESHLIQTGNYEWSRFPTEEVQLRFLRDYFGDNVQKETSLKLILAFAMLAELRWTLWALVQARTQKGESDFDYFHYANERFRNGYEAAKMKLSCKTE
jgi:thiamine kinase-like enzyme